MIFATAVDNPPVPANSSRKTTFGEVEGDVLFCLDGGEGVGKDGERERLREEEADGQDGRDGWT